MEFPVPVRTVSGMGEKGIGRDKRRRDTKELKSLLGTRESGVTGVCSTKETDLTEKGSRRTTYG